MRDNWHMRLVGTAVTLVPYRRRHVATYHGWMQDEELLAATASEPLSREEEYDMQRSWRDDGGKCTFLLAVGGDGGGADDRTIAGDVNLYLNAALPDEGDDGDVPEGAWEEETAPPAGVEEKEKDDKQKEEEEEAEAALDAMMAADADGGGDFHDDYDEMEQSDAPNSECDEDDGVDSDESDCDPAWLTASSRTGVATPLPAKRRKISVPPQQEEDGKGRIFGGRACVAAGAPIGRDCGVNNTKVVEDGGGPSDGRDMGVHRTASGVFPDGDCDSDDDEVEEDEEAILDAMMAADTEGHGDFHDDYDKIEGGSGLDGSGSPGGNSDDDGVGDEDGDRLDDDEARRKYSSC